MQHLGSFVRCKHSSLPFRSDGAVTAASSLLMQRCKLVHLCLLANFRDLSRNPIESIPTEFGNLTSLTVLCVGLALSSGSSGPLNYSLSSTGACNPTTLLFSREAVSRGCRTSRSCALLSHIIAARQRSCPLHPDFQYPVVAHGQTSLFESNIEYPGGDRKPRQTENSASHPHFPRSLLILSLQGTYA